MGSRAIPTESGIFHPQLAAHIARRSPLGSGSNRAGPSNPLHGAQSSIMRQQELIIDPVGAGITFILGAPRSGTTWLGKIFDSHPSVLYRHEPDIAAAAKLPVLVANDDITPDLLCHARRVIEAQILRRTVKTACSLPVFRKQADTPVSFGMRSAAAVTLKGLARVLPSRYALQLRMPARFDQPAACSHVVVKSVSSLGRAKLLAEAMPGARFIVILRNAFGQVASYLHGVRAGSFASDGPNPRIILAAAHPRYGLTEDKLSRMSLTERLAWDWTVMNEKALDDLEGLPQAMVIRHVDLAQDPLSSSRLLLQFARLPWTAQVETFVRRSSSSEGGGGYYSIWKRSSDVTGKWQTYLTAEEKRLIRDVMRETRVGKMWPELIES